jgi:hypothetical protein
LKPIEIQFHHFWQKYPSLLVVYPAKSDGYKESIIIERGTTKVSLETLVKICTIIDISLSYILTGVVVTTEDYLNIEIADMLKDCSPSKIRLIAEIISHIIRLVLFNGVFIYCNLAIIEYLKIAVHYFSCFFFLQYRFQCTKNRKKLIFQCSIYLIMLLSINSIMLHLCFT